MAEVGNGGIAQAAYNAPELLVQAVESFREVGCVDAADFCSAVVAKLPAELVAQIDEGIRDTDSVEEVFAHLRESELAEFNEQIPDDFWAEERLSQYAIKNRDQFISLDEP